MDCPMGFLFDHLDLARKYVVMRLYLVVRPLSRDMGVPHNFYLPLIPSSQKRRLLLFL
jgi:hypothetical protein